MSLFTSARRRLGWVAFGACCAATVGIAELHTARAASSSTPSSFVAVEPIRVLDTRVTDDIDGVDPRFTIDSIGRPIVTSTTLLGDLRLDIPWWITP